MAKSEKSVRTRLTKAREKQILGKPPRIPPLTDDKAMNAAMELTSRLRPAALPGSKPLTAEQMPEIMQTLMCHPNLWERVAQVSIQLLSRGALERRDTEFAILRAAWLCQAPYEWGEHVVQGKKFGLTAKEIERLIEGPSARGWSARDRAILRAVEELHNDAMVSERTWATLSKHFNHAQLFELLVLIGQFTLVAYFQNSLRLRLPEGSGGLEER